MTKMKKRRIRRNRIELLSIAAVVCLLFILVFIKENQLHAKNEAYILKEERLLSQIEEEEQRAEELEEQADYVKTKKYVEEAAKDKLGMVYPDEIIFKEKQD